MNAKLSDGQVINARVGGGFQDRHGLFSIREVRELSDNRVQLICDTVAEPLRADNLTTGPLHRTMNVVADVVAEKPIDLARYNGYVTVRNPATDGHRTFRVRTVRRGGLKGRRIVGLLVGSDNTSDYRDFGFVDDDGAVRVWRKMSTATYVQLANILTHCDRFADTQGLEFKMSVRCRKCNRDLTDPESIDLGIGPVCRQMKG